MGAQHETVTGAIELFPAPIPATPITDELARILTMLSEVSPRDATISFDFDGKLHVHFDVRRREDVAVVEAILPTLDGGRFHSLSRGATPHRAFFHRVSAVVSR